jgi:PAS domain S-box-containing protein
MDTIMSKLEGVATDLNKVGIAIWLNDEWGTTIDSNEAFPDMLGMSVLQIMGSSALDFTPPAFEPDFWWASEEMQKKGHLIFYKCFETMEGEWVPVKITAHVLENRKHILGAIERIDRLPFPDPPVQPYQRNLRDNVLTFRPRASLESR